MRLTGVPLVVGSLLLLGLLGCGRKEATSTERKQPAEADDTSIEASPTWEVREADSRAREQLQKGRDMQAQGRYAEALTFYAEAVECDENVGIPVALQKHLMADEMLAKAHWLTLQPFNDGKHLADSRQLIGLLLDEANGFMEKDVGRARGALEEWQRFSDGWAKLDTARKQLEAATQTIKGISEDFTGTALGEEAAKVLKKDDQE
jgi:tetratricopeptide (TPR) repeat protein